MLRSMIAAILNQILSITSTNEMLTKNSKTKDFV